MSLAGGASNKVVRVVLHGSGWRQPTVHVSTMTLVGAYDLSGGHFTHGGSVYLATLSAVGSIHTGYLLLTFRHS